MYFFIAFVFATFGLLYIYFKMHQKAKEDAAASRTGHLDHKLGKFTNRGEQKDTFFDFLAGQMDEEQ
jgi:hypothetical protein